MSLHEPAVDSVDFDQLDGTVPADEVRARYAQMRNRCPVMHNDIHGGYYMVSRYTDVRRAAADATTFGNVGGSFIPASGWPPIPPLDFDGAEHRRWLKVMQAPVSMAAVKELEPQITQIVDRQIDTFARDGSAELYTAFAEPVPALVIGRLVGLDEDATVEMRRVAMDMFGAIGTPDFDARMADFNAFAQAQLEERRRSPREDYLTQLASNELAGETFDDSEVAGIMLAFLVDGHHSTAAALASAVHHVLSVPGLKNQLLANPDLVPDAVEESLRLSTPLQFFARTALTEGTIAGTTVREGERVILNFASANLDEREFDEPQEFDLTRDRKKHLAFGHGAHLCLGRHLARAELRIGLTRLLGRLPDLEIAGPVVESGLVASLMLSLVALPVRFSPEGRPTAAGRRQVSALTVARAASTNRRRSAPGG